MSLTAPAIARIPPAIISKPNPRVFQARPYNAAKGVNKYNAATRPKIAAAICPISTPLRITRAKDNDNNTLMIPPIPFIS